MKILASVNIVSARQPDLSKLKLPQDFIWGVARATYQVEGAWQAEGKGESKWNFFANKIGVTRFTIGEKQTGNVAINQYDRKQYLYR